MLSRLKPTGFALGLLFVLGASMASSDTPIGPPAAVAAYAPAHLPGQGLDQHPFVYAGEWDYRKPEQTMFIVRDGRVVWTYSIPLHTPDGVLQEWRDATLLSNGNILFSRKTGRA
jgi:hypothetical protein